MAGDYKSSTLFLSSLKECEVGNEKRLEKKEKIWHLLARARYG
jgi:hypothetical protein